MKFLIIFIFLFGIFTVFGVNDVFADCNDPHCYAEWVNSGGFAAEGIKTDMQVSDIYAFPDNECTNEILQLILKLSNTS